jgi:acetyl esterase/lipase
MALKMGAAWLLSAATLAAVSSALAEPPADIATKLRAIGRVVEVRETAALYMPLHSKPPYTSARFVRDLKYGEDPKQTFDIATPVGSAERPRPVVMFVHDGGYVGGDKTRPDSPFYDNIMLWAVSKNMVGVNLNYRLAPAALYPAAQQDIGAAIRIIRKDIRRYGGDPNRIFIWGHSAGASHVASYIADPQFHPEGGPGVRGAILSSGSYDRVLGDIAQRQHVYYGEPAVLAQRSSISGLKTTPVPLFVSVAELDPPATYDQGINLNKVLCDIGRCPAGFEILKGHSHISASYHINTSDEALAGPLLKFINAR